MLIVTTAHVVGTNTRLVLSAFKRVLEHSNIMLTSQFIIFCMLKITIHVEISCN